MKLADKTWRIGAGAGAVACITCWQPLTWAKSITEIGQAAKSITVLIQGPDTGSGVLLRQDGTTYTVLTARHVINAPGNYEIVVASGQRYPVAAQNIQRLPGLDLALLKFTSATPQSVASVGNSNTLQEGMPVYVTGFPGQGSTINALTYNFTQGQLTARSSQPQEGGYALVYTNKTLPGMSGGPVFDQEARLVGIHGAADGQSQTLEKLNARVFMKTGFNLGIPINTFLRAASSKSAAGQTMALATPQTLEGSRNSTIQGQRTLISQSSAGPGVTPTASATTLDVSSDYFLAAMNHYRKGNLTSALVSTTKALQASPRFAAAYSLRGSIRYISEDYAGALADFSQAIQLHPLASAYVGRGLSQSALNQPQAAIADYTQAIQLSPDALAYYNRGVIQLNLGNQSAALQDLRKSADLALAEGNSSDYSRAMDALKVAGKDCQQSIHKICDR